MEQIINQLLSACLTELKKEETNEVMKRDLIDPMIEYIGQQIWPYVLFTCVLFVLMCLVIIAGLYVICKNNNSVKSKI